MENIKSIIICGDSFSIGIGCHDLTKEPFGVLLGEKLNAPVTNLGKGSSTNLSIFLQAKYAADKLASTDDLVIISNTSYDRANWFPYDHTPPGKELSNSEVNYHQYPPYGPCTYHQILNNPMAGDPNYTGKMFTDNYVGVIDYWETFGRKNKESGYYNRFIDEPKDRMKLMYDYATQIHDPRIERYNCIGVLTMAHNYLNTKKIRHLILTQEPVAYSDYINPLNLVRLSWGELSKTYPDDLPSLHTSPEGHKVAFQLVLDKINSNGWNHD